MMQKETILKILLFTTSLILNLVVEISPQKVSDRVGSPLDFKILEITTKTVKLFWTEPKYQSTLPIKHFLLSYVSVPNSYREVNGSLVNYTRGNDIKIRVPLLDGRIIWLITNLEPYTDYEFNISCVSAAGLQSPPSMLRLRTLSASPSRVEAPQVLKIFAENKTVLIKLANASARNGPISKYWLVIEPLDSTARKDLSSPPQSEQIQTELFTNSFFSVFTNESAAYIAAEFTQENWPNEFRVGDALKYGRFVNRK